MNNEQINNASEVIKRSFEFKNKDMKKESFVGKKVKVVNGGATYTTYEHAFKKLGFKYTTVNKSFNYNTKCHVFNQMDNPFDGTIILAIRDNEGNESLIGIRGVVILEEEMYNTINPTTFKPKDTVFIIIDNKLEEGVIKRIDTTQTETDTYTRCVISFGTTMAKDIEIERLYRTKQELINNL